MLYFDSPKKTGNKVHLLVRPVYLRNLPLSLSSNPNAVVLVFRFYSLLRTRHRLGQDDGSSLLARLTLLLQNLVRDAVQVALALGGQLAATLGQLLNQTDRLQGLQSLASDSGGGAAVVRWVHTVAPAAAVDAGHGSNASWVAVVHVAQDGRTANVVPVRVDGRQLLELGRLDQVDLVGHLQLAGPGIETRRLVSKVKHKNIVTYFFRKLAIALTHLV